MPRYISRAASYKKTVVKGENTLVQTPTGPQQVETRRPIIATFTTGGITPYERQSAEERFKFPGRGEEESMVTTLRRVSVFDTDQAAIVEGWSDDLKKEIEASLDEGQNSDYFRCDPLPSPKPWPSYDEFQDADAIASFAQAGGIDYESVRAYEAENENRAGVFKALEDNPPVAIEA